MSEPPSPSARQMPVPRILFETLGADPNGASEKLNAWRFIESATRYAQVGVATPSARAPWVLESGARLDVHPVAYGLSTLPFNGPLEYTYSVFSRRALRAVLASGAQYDVVHRLNPFAVRYASAFRSLPIPLVLGPLGGSVIPGAFVSSVADRASNALKTVDVSRLGSRWTALAATFDAASIVVCATSFLKDRLPARFHSKCEVLCEGVDADRFSATTYPPSDGGSEPRILFVGRFVRHKGADFLLRALARMPDQSWTLHVIGDGPLERDLRALAGSLGLADRVIWRGRVPHQRLPEEYAQAHVVCSPGVNESTGNVVMETMACGRPILVADWGGPAELVPDGCGLRVSVESIDRHVSDMSQALTRVLLDRDFAAATAAAALDHARRHHDWRVVLDRMHDIHLRAAGEAAARRAARDD
jgi:glycosyltransferase involved in cell wall biosynthesis